jgi:hypothetical protein
MGGRRHRRKRVGSLTIERGDRRRRRRPSAARVVLAPLSILDHLSWLLVIVVVTITGGHTIAHWTG